MPASVTFHRVDEGGVTHATLHQNGEHRATRIDGEEDTFAGSFPIGTARLERVR